MSDLMQFPETWEEFEANYGFTDSEEVYTNGARLIPSFRVEQWLEHIDLKHGKWKIERDPSGVQLMVCDCGFRFPALLGLYRFKYCPSCRAKMDKGDEDE